MSNVIKSSRVLYDRAPRTICLESDGSAVLQQSAEDVGQLLSNNALESADLSLKLAVARAEEVANRSRVEVQLNFLSAVKDGKLKGHEDGLLKGRSDGAVCAAENVRTAVQELIAHVCRLDMAYLGQLSETKADCVDFAFSLAEDILGIKIDRESGDYANLISKFLSKTPGKATLEADGCAYQLETFRPDFLLSSVESLQGISVSIEEAEADEQVAESEQATECDQSAECEQTNQYEQDETDGQIDTDKQEDIGIQNIADVQTDVEEQSIEAEEFSTDKIDTDQDVQNENRMNQPEAELPDTEHTTNGSQIPVEFGLEDDAAEPQAHDDLPIDDDILDETEIAADCENIIDSEKFVFVRPERKSVTSPTASDICAKHEMRFEDIARIGQDNLKILSRKAAINDIAAALSGADEAVNLALMNAMTRRTKQNVLDVMKYLGPMSQADTEAARNKLVKLSTDIVEANERDETDV